MANPRRSSFSNTHSTPTPILSSPEPQTQFLSLSSLSNFLRRPQAFPILLSIFVLLTWVSLRLQDLSHVSASEQPHQSKLGHRVVRGGGDEDGMANLVRFSSGALSSRDKRGWLLDPVVAARDAGILDGAVSCASVHVGEIRPGGVRANHRHHTCNETFVIWGAETKFRLENPELSKGYAEVIISAEEVAVAASQKGRAHALVNIDPVRTTFFLGCQDSVVTYHNNTTDFKVWSDL